MLTRLFQILTAMLHLGGIFFAIEWHGRNGQHRWMAKHQIAGENIWQNRRDLLNPTS
jgi:hypothetical protein